MGRIMNKLEEIQAQYKFGYPILCKIAQMTDDEIREFVRKVLSLSGKKYPLIVNSGKVERTISDSCWKEVAVYYYDHVKIDWIGVYLHAEHGVRVPLILFNEETNILVKHMIPEELIPLTFIQYGTELEEEK